MNNPYDLHSWSHLYREEALRKAWERHLADQARVGREQYSGRSRVGLIWAMGSFKVARKADSKPPETASRWSERISP